MLPAVVLLFYALTGILLCESAGFYDNTILVLAAGFAACIVAMIAGRVTPAGRTVRYLAGATPVLFSVLLITYGPRSPVRSGALPSILWVARLACAMSLPLCVLALPQHRSHQISRAFQFVAGAMLLLLVAEASLVPTAMPDPGIDVWVTIKKSARYLSQGINPYSVSFPDITGGRYDYAPGYPYFPAALLIYAPLDKIGIDLRWAHIVGTLAAAAGFAALAVQRRLKEPLPWLVAILWLSFPIGNLVLGLAWLDPLIVPCFVWAAWALARKHWARAGILLGLAVAIKQYGFVALGPAVVLALRQEGVRAGIRLGVAAVAACAAIVLPFAIDDWPGFSRLAIQSLSNASMRPDAYSLLAFANAHYQWIVPAAARFATTATGGLAGLAWIARTRTPEVRTWAAATCLSFGIAFLFGKFAFCNYYYLLASCVLIYFVSTLAPTNS